MFDLNRLFAGFFVVEWVIRLVMLFIVPRKLRPANANAWLLLIMVAPSIGTIVFYMFGAPKLPTRRREHLKQVNDLTATEIDQLRRANPGVFSEIEDADLRSIAKLATYLGGLPPKRGNAVQFQSDYEAVFASIAASIDEAQDFVHIEYFVAAYDESTKVVFDAVARATSRGVKVRFLYDKLLSRPHGNVRLLEKVLTQSGADVRAMMPLRLVPGPSFTRPDLRNHRKIVVVDGVVAYSGSQNLVDKTYARKDSLYYEDVVGRFEGPVVWQLNNVFRADWFAETGQPLLDTVEDLDMPPPAGNVIAQVLPSGPSYDNDNNVKLYTAMVHAAKEQVRIVVPYFVPDESLLDAITAAAQRGVSVTMINSEVKEKLFSAHAQRSYYEELLKAGVELYLYEDPVFLHTKQVIIDSDVAIVGSSNLDRRSFELDFEVNTIVYDREAVLQLLEIESTYFVNSQKITLEQWHGRSLPHKMLDSVARLTAGLQ